MLLRRLHTVLRTQGLGGVAAKLVGKVADQAFERRHGIDTIRTAQLDDLTIRAGRLERGHFYEGSRVLPLRALLRDLRRGHDAHDDPGALVDIGCGKGKVLLVAAAAGWPTVRGIEFAHELCLVARANWEKFRTSTGPDSTVEIIESDAAAYAIRPDETTFFLFNPFGVETLAHVLDNLARSAAEHPRRIEIVVACLTPHYQSVFDRSGAFVLERHLVCWGYPFSVFVHARE
ncbi:MAG TPA: hypothetical protein VEQ85_16805 [Lacipirellulaceae bacterium]|nr:hypothetical protein [Lacipirellulaceae bacterium]